MEKGVAQFIFSNSPVKQPSTDRRASARNERERKGLSIVLDRRRRGSELIAVCGWGRSSLHTFALLLVRSLFAAPVTRQDRIGTAYRHNNSSKKAGFFPLSPKVKNHSHPILSTNS